MTALVVIPARGGSKGIPRKNLLPVGGRPLIAWTIAQALEAQRVGAGISAGAGSGEGTGPGTGASSGEDAAAADVIVAVSTEDPEIAEVSRAHGARVIERPAELAVDTAPTEPVVLHAMDVIEAELAAESVRPAAESVRPGAESARPAADRTGPEGPDAEGAGERRLDAVVLLQATSPVRRPDTIARALAQFRESGADSLVGVVPESPFFWRLPERPGESALAAYDVTARPRRQELLPEQMHYFENGSLYVTAPHIYRTQRNRIGGRTELFVLDEVEGVDIDTLTDVAAAESMLARLGWRTS